MIRELVLGAPFLEKKRLIRKTEFWPAQKLADLQTTLLLAAIRHAVRKVPYYRKTVDQDKLLDAKDAFGLLECFPLVDKSEIRKHLRDFLSGHRLRHLKVKTGGSAGQPLLFYSDRFATRQREKAFIFDLWKRVGYKFGDRIFNIRGRTPPNNRFIQHDPFFNIYYASSFRISKSNINEYIHQMNRIQPKFLHGYPSTIYQLALLIDCTRHKLVFQYKAVLCCSEKLFHYQRQKIESVFGCRVYTWYGLSECLALGGECEHSQMYHFYPQYGYTELLPTGLKRDDGKEVYEIVATGFNNSVMPLIRYRTGDYAVLPESQKCSCGRNYLLIDEIIGREQEFVIDVNGTVISATSLIFGQHYEAFVGLESIQIHQNKPGEMEVVLVKGDGYQDRFLHLMKEKMGSLLGERMNICFSFTDAVNKSPIGKAKLVNQELDVRQFLQ